MSLRNRLGNFLLFISALSLFVFFASLLSPNININFGAGVLGAVLLFFGWRMSRARSAAPPPPPAAKAALPKPGAPRPGAGGPGPRAAGPAAKKRGLMTTLMRGPAKKAPPPPPPPPPPPKKKGLAGLFSPKPKPRRK